MTSHAGPGLLEVARAEPDLRSRVTVVAAQLQERIRTIGEVLMALRPLMQAEREQPAGPPEFVVRANRELLERLTEVFEIDRGDLRVDPATAALVLRSVVFGSQHPGMTATPGLSAEQVADVIVGGIARCHAPGVPVLICPAARTAGAVPRLARRRRRAPAPGHPGDALPAHAQRRHHRPGHRPRRHGLHRARRADDARRVGRADPGLGRRRLVRRPRRDGTGPRPARGAVPPRGHLLGP